MFPSPNENADLLLLVQEFHLDISLQAHGLQAEKLRLHNYRCFVSIQGR